MVRRIMTIALSALVVSSCNQLDLKGMFMPTGEGVETRFEISKSFNEDLYSGTVNTQQEYIFYVAADPHINETHANLTTFNDALKNDEVAAFGVILGDCTDIRDNIQTYMDAFTYNPDSHRFNQKIFHVLGNHDLFFNGWVDFKSNVGPSVFWFETAFEGGKDLYISLDTATGTLGRKQSKWFKAFVAENGQNYRHCVILTHTNLFYTDNSQTSSGNMPLEETYALIDFLGKQDVTLVLQGHDHYRDDLTYDGVRYTVLGTIKDEANEPEYLKVTASDNGLALEWIILSGKQ